MSLIKPRNLTRYDIDHDVTSPFPVALPYTRTVKRSSWKIIVTILFSLIWQGFLAVFLYLARENNQAPDFLNVFLGFFALVGLTPVYMVLRFHRTIELYVDRNRVSYISTPIVGSADSVEATVAEFTGIQQRSFLAGKKDKRQMYEVALVHSDPASRVALGYFTDEEQQQKATEFFAVALNKSIVELNTKGKVIRAVRPSEVNLVYAERESAESHEAEISNDSLPDDIEIKQLSDGFEARVTPKNRWAIALVFLLVGVSLYFSGKLDLLRVIIWTAVSALIFIVVTGVRVVRVTAQEVSFCLETRIGRIRAMSASTIHIEEINPRYAISSEKSEQRVQAFVVRSDASRVIINTGSIAATTWLYRRVKKSVAEIQKKKKGSGV